MSLALFLLRDLAYVACTAANIATSAAVIKNQNNSNRARAEAMRAQQGRQAVEAYDIDLFLAKVAMLAYIAKSDRVISREERMELEQTLGVAERVYGREATARARQIFDREGISFISLEPYLARVQNRDLDSFIFYSEEYAKTDNELTPEESSALKKLHSYIESRKGKRTFENLICPTCGAAMRADAYGYKAVCQHCGYEMVLNTENSPYRLNALSVCSQCGATFDHPGKKNFCRYCGGKIINAGGQTDSEGNPVQYLNGANLFITYNTTDPSVGLVTRIVSTGMINNYTDGQTRAFNLAPGSQTIVLKIGRKNHNRDIVIPISNSPVRIYASYDGFGHISIDQPTM